MSATLASPTTDLVELAAEAYIFGFPILEMHRARSRVLNAEDPRLRAAPNTFRHVRKLATHNSREVTAPNNDTLYSSAWLDLSAGPVSLSVPALGDRYYSYAFMDMFTNVFALASRRTAPGGDRRYTIVGPRWRGDTPEGTELIVAPTETVWLLARFLVDGPEDFPAVHALQDASILRGPSQGSVTQRTPVNAAIEDDAARLFDTLNGLLSDNPPPPADAAVMARMQAIGGADAATLASGGALARTRLRDSARQLRKAGGRSGWSRPPMTLGNFGTDYVLRAVTALVGLAALPPAEAMYLSTTIDAGGQPLNGKHDYVLHFAPDRLPPAKAFWSLTLYEIDAQGRSWLVKNALHRYSIGDRTPGLVRGADGSLAIHITRDTTQPNCLPSPQGPFMLSMRVYEPDAALLEGHYDLPAVEKRS